MPHSLNELLSDIEGVLTDGPRKTSYDANLDAAQRLAATLPLVHRTGHPAQPLAWREILRNGELRVSTDITDTESQCGWSRAVYFFLGCAAYPKGNVAFMLDRAAANNVPGNFSAFDSGALSRGFIVPRSPAAWSISDRSNCLDRNSANAKSVESFAGPYVAAHFNRPDSYVSSPQHSETDFEPYHGLRSTDGDRRAWTIEVRLHNDMRINPPEGILLHIVLANRAFVADVPDELLDRVVFADTDLDGEGDVARTVADIALGRR